MFQNNASLENAMLQEAKSAVFEPKDIKIVDEKSQDASAYNKAVFSWEALEYIHHPKTLRWYITAGIIILAAAVIAFLNQNWTFSIALIAFFGVYYYIQEHHPPKRVTIVISEMGFKVGQRVFPFTELEAFWIVYNPPSVKTLNLRVKKKHAWDLVIQLNDQDPVEIRQFLLGQIPEWEGKNETLSDIVVRILKL